MFGDHQNCRCVLYTEPNWSNRVSRPVTAREIIGDGWAAMFTGWPPLYLAQLGKQYGFRRARAWETPKAYRQSLTAFMTYRTLA